MKQLVNKNLITLKCVLFCFLSGVGCIYPFLPLHMLSVGLDKGEARLISAVAPCIALLGPAVLGPLIDKLSVGRGSTGGGSGPSGSGRLLRIVTAICLILSAVFYTLLLAVPSTERHEARRPQVLFMCDEDSAYVMQEVCKEEMRCNRWAGEKTGVLAVTACEYGCADENMTWVRQPFTTTSTTTTLSPMYQGVMNTTTVEPQVTEENEVFGVQSEVNPPHFCYNGQCLVYLQHQARMRVPLSLIAPDLPEDNNTADSDWCTYRTAGPSRCSVPQQRLEDILMQTVTLQCKPAVRCQVLDPYDEPDGVLADAECRLVVGDPSFTFWTYLIIRILADIWPISALALLGAACVIATRETSLGRGDVGRQLAFGTLGLAIFPPLAGLAAEQMPDTPYLVALILHAVFMLIGALILILDSHMPLSTPEWWWHTSTGVLTMPMNVVRRYGAETAAVFAVVALLGTLWSGIDAYLPCCYQTILRMPRAEAKHVSKVCSSNFIAEYCILEKFPSLYHLSIFFCAIQFAVGRTVKDLNGTIVEAGLTLTAGALPAIPALWWAEALVDYIGHSNVFIMAFTFYGIRYTGLAYSGDYSWVLVCEILEVFTLSLVWVTAVLYFRHLVPRKYTTTGQALPVIAHFCIGRCLGAIIGGLVSMEQPLESVRSVYRGLGVVALLTATIYFALYHLLLAPRCAAPAVAPPNHLLQACSVDGQLDAKGLNSNGSSNGTYSPMRVYHEERSRKGHFRY